MSDTNMFAFFDGVSEGFKASRSDILDVLEEIKQEVENINPTDYGWIGDYKIHSGAKECKNDVLEIIDKHIREI